jgi:hypothetical protein
MTITRDLTANERDLLLSILAATSFEGAEELRTQVPHAEVVGGIPTLLELAVGKPAPAARRRDGPIPVRTLVQEADGSPAGEIFIWVTDGYLSGLEFAWVTDSAPIEFPNPERVRSSPYDWTTEE